MNWPHRLEMGYSRLRRNRSGRCAVARDFENARRDEGNEAHMRSDATLRAEGTARALPALLALVVACAGASPTPASVDAAAPALVAAPEDAYRLGGRDKLRIIVFGEEELSGEFEVDSTGRISLPLIGQVRAQGQTLRELEERVADRLRDGYLRDPRVNAEVMSYRPFYIIGEVENGGEYPFVSGMNVLNAVALAGGYTYRANESKVFITRNGREHEFSATAETRIRPGDVIRVSERLF